VSRPIRKRAVLVALGYAAVLTTVSLLPSGGTGPLSGWDKEISPGLQNLLHVPAYGVLVWLVAWAMRLGRLWHLVVAAMGCAALGGLLECVQAAVPGRFGSLEDALLNAVGTGVAVLILVALRKFGRMKDKQPVAETSTAASGHRP